MTSTDRKPSADEIADMADAGKDVSRFFTSTGRMKRPIHRANADFTVEMLEELDDLAAELNVGRQAVIKSYLRLSLDQHYLAKRKSG